MFVMVDQSYVPEDVKPGSQEVANVIIAHNHGNGTTHFLRALLSLYKSSLLVIMKRQEQN